MQKLTLLLCCCLLIVLSGCETEQVEKKIKVKSSKTNASQELVLKSQSWLSRKLPKNTLAYMRLPTPWNQFFQAKGDMLHPVQESNAHITQIKKIKRGLVKAYTNDLSVPIKQAVELLLNQAKTPLEFALINADEEDFKPAVLMGTTLDNLSIAQIQSTLTVVSEYFAEGFSIVQAINDEGEGRLRLSQYDVLLKYNQDSGRLALMGGESVGFEALKLILHSQRPAQELNTMLDIEKKYDASGLGTHVWVAIERIYQLTATLLPESDRKVIESMGLDKAQYLWLGSAAGQGYSELIVHLEMPEIGFRSYVPRVNSIDGLHTAGNPRSVMNIAVPNMEQMAQAFEYYVRDDEQAMDVVMQVDKAVENVNAYLGFNVEDIFTSYGQKLYWVSDDAGDWLAVKIVNMDKHRQIMEALSKAFEVKGSVQKMGDLEIHQSHIESTKLLLQQMSMSGLLMQNFPKFKTHIYWLVDGDYLVMASVPQVLADRANSKERQKLNVWLKSQQDLSWEHAVFSYSKEIKDGPREIYYYYLTFLQMLADAAETEIDLYGLPTAHQLNLPDYGRLGLRLDSNKNSMSFHLSYQYSLLESFYGIGSIYTLYAASVAASIVPFLRAYYRKDTDQIIIKSMAAIPVKRSLLEYYLTHDGKHPSEEEFNALVGALPNDIIYESQTGDILIDVAKESGQVDAFLRYRLTNKAADSSIQWSCSSNLPPELDAQFCQ